MKAAGSTLNTPLAIARNTALMRFGALIFLRILRT